MTSQIINILLEEGYVWANSGQDLVRFADENNVNHDRLEFDIIRGSNDYSEIHTFDHTGNMVFATTIMEAPQ